MIEVQFPITVVCSPQPRVVRRVELLVETGCTVGQALQLSGILVGMSQTELNSAELGVWGRKALAKQVLRANDRVEIYRQLTVDPKVARRERFARQGAKTAGLFAKRRAGAKAGY